MRVLALRGLSLLGLIALVAWEIWKAADIIQLITGKMLIHITIY